MFLAGEERKKNGRIGKKQNMKNGTGDKEKFVNHVKREGRRKKGGKKKKAN